MAQWLTISVVPAAIKDQVNALLMPLNHDLTFTVPLTTPGGTVATHYWACHRLTDEQIAQLAAALPPELVAQMQQFYEIDPEQVLAVVGLERLTGKG